MLDIRIFREETERVRRGLQARMMDAALADKALELDGARRELVTAIEAKKQTRNETSKQIGAKIKAGEDAEPVKEQMRILGDEIKAGDDRLREIDAELDGLLLNIPNLPHESVPVGGEADFRVERDWGEKPQLSFEPKQHDELAKTLGLLELERASKITGSNWPCFRGKGARLVRALLNMMLDMHVDQHGMTEIYPPFVVNRQTMTGTGQLPKFEEDLYRCDAPGENRENDLFLIPTAEVPVTNLHSGEILSADELPINYCAFTPCFRREAGSYGKETRGLTRVHQFDKVEMVKFVDPKTSYDELERLLACAEDVLQALGLHYRVITLASGDLGFSAAKCYDIEVWAPGAGRYLECSSCSNFEDFQARRANIRFRREAKAKPEFVHTLNASGLALPRTIIALMETYQQAGGTIRVPEALRQYYRADVID
ncbi:serine--tRNA ligase [Candidatus Sumerlaeota bacterium]|nr:serine--tRNA ligase [Candidatus Sumerlaeota bacterium]